MQIYDVIIVGAGPAGCSAVIFSQSDKILIIDQNQIPRKKPCGGILIEESVEFIKNMNPPDYIFEKPKNMDLRYIDLDNNVEAIQKRGFQNIDRTAFDLWLLKTAKNKAEIMEKTRVIDFYFHDEFFTIKTENNGKKENVRSRFLIDATGAFSFSRTNKAHIYSAVQFSANNDGRQTFDYILYSKINDYYSWIIPKGERIVVGSAFSGGNITEKILNFKKIISDKFDINDFGPMEAAPITKPKKEEDICLAKNNCLIIGEAAGLISASTGDGISYALASGKNCAEAINRSNNNINNAIENYTKNSIEIVNDVKEKIRRAEIFSDPQKRKKILKKN
ncbi:MAG: FAD-dependent oxidoreductase [Candidatus Aenigmatarchaeota archaeon]